MPAWHFCCKGLLYQISWKSVKWFSYWQWQTDG